MAGKASITMDIKARITGYQEEVAKIQAALDKIKLDTGIGKELKAEVEAFQKELGNLEKNLNPRVSTASGIQKVEDKLTNAAAKLQEIGGKLQNVTLGDLDTSKLSEEIENIKKEISELEEVSANDKKNGLEQKLQSAIDHGSNLGRVLKELNIDIKEATGDKIKAGLAEGFKAAQEQIKKADEEIQNLKKSAQEYEREIEKIEASTLNQPGAQEAAYNKLTEGNLKVKDTVDITKAEDKLSQWYNLTEKSTRLSDEAKEKVMAFLASFEVPSSLAEANRAISDFIANAQQIGTTQTALKSIFGTSSFFKDTAIVDPQTVEQVKSNIREVLVQFKDEIGNSSKDIELLISRGAIEEARNKTIKLLDDAFKSFEGVLPEKYAQLFSAINKISELEGQKNSAATMQQNITKASASVDKINEQLLQRIEAQDQEIANLKTQLDNLASGQLADIHKTGSDTANNAKENIKGVKKETQEYGKELDKVNEKQKLIGKIEGLAQRWFSIYAAVNLVKRAFNEVKKTIQELDDVMTKIAIVTKMTQADLWAQMPQYTEMARQYASSIKGVYEISQLYYQQGLQTNEVMELTEETLKMARISGLDYATATDYMTNALRSFKMEMSEAQTIVDVYSNIAAKSATNTAELATAMSKTASSAESVGSSFENTTAMMAVMIESTRESATNIGSAMKSIISRYGELKDDPTKLVDSEGEEMSFNKVDTALRSVGISMHDVNGQFRDFDDVIIELSSKWNSLDKNTQRYIATIMAGNRQQSRFLALVSNGERLAELSEEAANSADVATLQVLKTMDSVSAKAQQLQTSLQSMYVSTGLENAYKGILDFSNEVVKTFTRMPTIFNLPIPALLNFGQIFITLGSTFGDVLRLIKGETLYLKNELQQDATETANHVEAEAERAGQAVNRTVQNSQKNASIWQRGGMTAAWRMVGSTISLVAAGLNEATESTRLWKSALQATGGVIQTISFMVAKQPWMAAFTGVMALVSAVNTFIETTEERAERLKKAADDAKNNYLQKRNDYKDMDKEIQKLKELEKAQYDSEEAKQAYIDASNEIAEKCPELVASYTSEGNAVIDLANQYQILAKKREEAAEAEEKAGKTAAEEAYNRYTTSSQNKAKSYFNGLREEYGGDGTDSVLERFSNAVTRVNALAGADYTISDKLDEFYRGIFYPESAEHAAEVIEKYQHGYFDDVEKFLRESTEYSDLADKMGEMITSSISMTEKVKRDIQDDYESFVITGRTNLLEEINWENTRKKLLAEYDEINETVLNAAPEIGSLIDEYVVNKYDTYVKSIKAAEGDEEKIKLIDKNYDLEKDPYTNYLENNFDKDYKDIYDKLEQEYNEIDINSREAFISAITNRGKYNRKQFEELIKGDEFGITDKVVLDALMDYYKTSFKLTDFMHGIRGKDLKINELDTVKALYTLSGQELQSALQVFNNFNEQVKNGSLSQDFGEDLFNSYLSLWSSTSVNGEIDEAAQSLLTGWTDFSLSGVQQLIDTIDKNKDIDENVKKNLINQLNDLKNIIPININTEIQTLAATASENLENYEKDISNAMKGMNYKNASEMAAKLGKTISDFRYSNGKWYYDEIEDLRKANNLQKQEFSNEITNRIEELKKLNDDSLISFTNDKKEFEQYRSQIESAGLNFDEVFTYVTSFYEQLSSDEPIEDFGEYLDKILQGELKAIDDATNDIEANAYLAAGQINNFFDSIANEIDENTLKDLKDAYKSGDLEKIQELLPQYATQLGTAIGDQAKKAYDTVLAAITQRQTIKIDSTNVEAYKNIFGDWNEGELKEEFKDSVTFGYDEAGNVVSIALDNMTAAVYSSLIDLSGSIYTEEEKIKKKSEARTDEHNKTLEKAVFDILTSGDTISQDAVEIFKLRTGKDIEKLFGKQRSDGSYNKLSDEAFETIANEYKNEGQLYETIQKEREERAKNLLNYTSTLENLTEKQPVDEELKNILQGKGGYNFVQNDYGAWVVDTVGNLDEGLGALKEYIEQYYTIDDSQVDELNLKIAKAKETRSSYSIKQAFSDVTITGNKIIGTIDQINELSNKLKSAGVIKDSLTSTYDSNGNYKVNIDKELQDIIDEYGIIELSITQQLQDFSTDLRSGAKLLSEGTTDTSAMQEFADKYDEAFGNEKGTTSWKSLFKYDESSKSYKLSITIFEAYINQLQEILKQAGVADETIAEILGSAAKEISAATDISDFLKGNRTQKEAKELRKKIQDSLVLSGKNNDDAIKQAADLVISSAHGGTEFVEKRAQYVKDVEGRDLTPEEAQEAYFVQMTPLLDIFEEMQSIGQGSYVSDELAKYLTEEQGWTVINNVVTAVGNSVEVYKQIYDEMFNTGEATAENLAKVASKINEEKNRQKEAVESLVESVQQGREEFGDKDYFINLSEDQYSFLKNLTSEQLKDLDTAGAEFDEKESTLKIRKGMMSDVTAYLNSLADISDKKALEAIATTEEIIYNDSVEKAVKDVFNDINNVSNEAALNLMSALGLNPEDRKKFFESIGNNEWKLKIDKISDIAKLALDNGADTTTDTWIDMIYGVSEQITDKLRTAGSQLGGGVGDEVNEEAASILLKAGYSIKQIGSKYFITGVGDVVQAYEEFYYTISRNNSFTAQEVKDARKQLVDAFNAEREKGFSIIKDLGNIDSLGSWIDFSDGLEILDKGRLNKLSKDLAKAGATLEDGIIKTFDSTNLIQVNEANLKSLQEQLGKELNSAKPDQNAINRLKDLIIETQDSITNVIKDYIGLISDGIKGSLSVEKMTQLENFAQTYGLEIDFNKTEEGLKLSQKSAMDLYLTMKDVDYLQSRVLFKDLSDNLKESSAAYQDVVSIQGRIAKLQKEINNLPVGSARRQEYEKELEVAREIREVRSLTDEDSFKFMDRDLPTPYKAGLGYWDSVGKMFKEMNDAAESGYMDVTNFYNMVNGMNEMAQNMGHSITFMGMELDGSMESASKVIQKGFNSLANVDGTGAKVSMEKMGAGIYEGALGMQSGAEKGIKEFAKTQIKMLDAMIAFLEVVVAFEDFDKLDIDSDGLEFDEVFETLKDGSIHVKENAQSLAKNMLDAAKTNPDLMKGLKGVKINGTSMYKMMQELATDSVKSKDLMDKYYKNLSIMVKAAKDGDFSTENLTKLIQEAYGGSDELIQVDVFDRHFAIKGDVVIEKDENGNYVVDGKKYTSAKLAIAAQTAKDKLGLEKVVAEENGRVRGHLTVDGKYDVEVITSVRHPDKVDKYVINDKSYATRDEAINALYKEATGKEFDPDDPSSQRWILESDAGVTLGMSLQDIEIKSGKNLGEWTQEQLEKHGINTEIATGVKAGIQSAFEDPEFSLGKIIIDSLMGSEKEQKNFNDRVTETIKKSAGIGKNTRLRFDNEPLLNFGIQLADGILLGLKAGISDPKTKELNISNILLDGLLGSKDKNGEYKDNSKLQAVGEQLGKGLMEAMGAGLSTNQNGTEEGTFASKMIEAINLAKDNAKPVIDDTMLLFGLSAIEKFKQGFTMVGDDGESSFDQYFIQPFMNLINDSLVGEMINAGINALNNFKQGFSMIGDDGESSISQYFVQPFANLINDSLSGEMITTGINSLEKFKQGFTFTDDEGKSSMTEMFSRPFIELIEADLAGEQMLNVGKNAVETFISGFTKGSEEEDANGAKTVAEKITKPIRTALEELFTKETLDKLVKDFETNSTIKLSFDSIDVGNLTTATEGIATAIKTATEALDTLKTSIDKIESKEVTFSAKLKGEASTSMSAHVESNGVVTVTADAGSPTATASIMRSYAKGNVALVKGRNTLMGELGPELYVTGGRYYVAGQNGAEMVDLPDDAIVFNHLQTKKLLGTGHAGRGKAVTNEKNAVSYATGNVSGPAMASARETLNELKALRAMWQSMLTASFKDLGGLAKSSKDTEKSKSNKDSTDDNADKETELRLSRIVEDVERWYNLERQIAKLEKDISYSEKLINKYQQDRVANGDEIYNTYKTQLKLLDSAINKNRELVQVQRDWYDEKRAELENSVYGLFISYDENGLQQLKNLDILEKLQEETIEGEGINNSYSVREQVTLLGSLGADLRSLLYDESDVTKYSGMNSLYEIYDSEGQLLEGQDLYDAWAKIMENFYSHLEDWKTTMDSSYDGMHETEEKIVDELNQQNSILQGLVDNQIEVENAVLEAIVDSREAEIDELQKTRDAYEDSVNKMVDGLNEALDKEREMYKSEEERTELTKLQRQLAILQRSGGSASQIRSLQNQITSKQQDMYFDTREKEIEAIQDAADKQIERMDTQIDLMTETLEYQKEYGLLWDQVYQIMALSNEGILGFITENGASWKSESHLQKEEDIRALLEQIQVWTKTRDDEELEQISEKANNASVTTANRDESVFSKTEKKELKPWEDSISAHVEEITADLDNLDAIKTNASTSNQTANSSNNSNNISVDSLKGQTAKMAKKYTGTEYVTDQSRGWEQHPVQFTISKGASVKIIKELKKGYRIKAPDGNVYDVPKEYVQFKNGGLIDFTGPAWVDGSKSKPEAILSNEQLNSARKTLKALSDLRNKFTNGSSDPKEQEQIDGIKKKWEEQRQLEQWKEIMDGFYESLAETKTKIEQAAVFSVRSQLQELESIQKDLIIYKEQEYASINGTNNNGNIYIETVELNMNAQINDGYSAKRAGQQVFDEFIHLARKNGVNSISRR